MSKRVVVVKGPKKNYSPRVAYGVCRVVWSWFKPKNGASYKIFTTEFDRVVDGNTLSAGLGADERQVWQAQIAVYEAETERARG